MVSNIFLNPYINLSLNKSDLSHEDYFKEVLQNEHVLTSDLISSKIRMAVADKLVELFNTKSSYCFSNLRSIKKISQFLLGHPLLNSVDLSIDLADRLKAANYRIFKNKTLELVFQNTHLQKNDSKDVTKLFFSMTEAVTYGYLDDLIALVQLNNDIDYLDNDVILCAAEHGQYSCFEFLYRRYEIESEVLSASLYLAAANNKTTCLKKMLVLLQPSDFISFGALKCAVENNDKDSLSQILKLVPLDGKFGVSLLDKAVEFDFVECFDEIFTHLDHPYTGGAFIKSAKHGSVKCLKRCLNHGIVSLTPNNAHFDAYMVAALLLVSENKHTKCLEFLVNSWFYHELALVNAIEKSIGASHFEGLQLLLSTHPDTTRLNEIALLLAIGRGNTPFVNFIIDHYLISEITLNTAIMTAVLLGHDQIVEVLQEYLEHLQLRHQELDVHSEDRDKKTYKLFKLPEFQQKENIKALDVCLDEFLEFIKTFKDMHKIDAAIDSLMGPDKEHQWPALLGDHFHLPGIEVKISGNNVFRQFWTFASTLKDLSDCENAKTSLFSALSDSIENDHRICNPGKLQRMVTAVLCGRIEGVNLDEYLINATDSLNMFFSIEAHRSIDNLDILITKAHEFTSSNKLIPKEEFMNLISEYAIHSGIT
jgi:hypothetical protein